MPNRDDWERSRIRGWNRDRDWETEDRYSEPFRGVMSEEDRERWGSSGRFGQSGYGRSWEREGEGSRGYGSSLGERREGDWQRYPREGYGRMGESSREWYGRREGVGGFGPERVGESYGREGAMGIGRSYRRGYAAEWRRGPFTGRGPKGWKRSDERIQEEVNEFLARHPDLDATSIEVRVKNGEVTLTGVVEDRHDKRLAEDVAEDIFGVEDVHNELKVRHGAFARITGEHADEEDERSARQSATTTRGNKRGTR